MKVGDLMTKRPVTVKPNYTLGRVVKILSERDISGCPVVSNRRLVGIVTQTDIIKAIDVYQDINKNDDIFSLIAAVIKSKKYDNIKSGLRKIMRMKVKEFMKDGVVHIEEEDDIYEAANMINQHGIDRLPVVRDGRLVGILSKTDILKLLKNIDSSN